MSVPAHLMLLEQAAEALSWMDPPPVYIGGATVAIHLGDNYALWARETDDVMPTNGQWYGHTTTWLPTATENTFAVELPSGRVVRVLRVEWLFAAKLEAYWSRGHTDPYMSKDLEDLVLLALGCAQLVERVNEAPMHLREWVAQGCAKLNPGDVQAQTPGVFDPEDAMAVFEELARS